MACTLLGIDNGCTVSKAALFDLDGRELAVASARTEVLSPRPGWQERDMEAMWQTTATAVRQVLAQAGVPAEEIACVTCTGHGNGLYLLDRRGRPARPAILSTDARARAYSDAWCAAGLDERVRPKTMQSVWAAQPNALLAWLRDHEPETFAATDWVLMAKDYIRYRLTNEVRAELTDFSGTSLVNLNTRTYDEALLADFGIAEVRELLPPLVQSADLCGRVTAEAAAQTGLVAGTPVAGGNFDIDACGLACGMVDEGPLCMVVGTWGNNQYISRTPVVDADVFMTSCYSIPDYYLMLEGSATSGSNLEWFVNRFLDTDAAGGNVYERCNRAVAATDPRDSRIVFLPFLHGSNANPDARACLLGLSAWHDRGHVLRAVYEGVVFAHRTHVERLLKFRDMPAVLRITGGATRSDVWLQVFADCFQVPVQVPQGTELGALGAALTGGVAAGCFRDYAEAVAAMVHVSRRIEPDPDRTGLYAEKYACYHQTIRALDPLWHPGSIH